MLKALFGNNSNQQDTLTALSQPSQLTGTQSGINASDVDSILITGQSHLNVAESLRSDPLGHVPMMKIKRVFTKAEASALQRVASETKVLAESTKEAADYLVEVNEHRSSINKSNNRVISSNLATTTSMHGSNSKMAELAEKQRLNHNNNALSYQETRANIDAQIAGKLAGYGL